MVGKTISHYRIVEKIGEGGMGVVYKAEDTKLHRTVALKFIRPDAVESPELKARFLNEAEAAAALNHPAICVVYEIDDADEQSFIAMEYVEGESLAEKIKKRPLPLNEALDIAGQIAEGLQAAHEKGIDHRDIKPANVMIDAAGRAKVMDFGLAHLEEATRITKTGAVMGTPAYMSPEQVRGETVDQRTDIWSLGVVLYEMLAGRMPFRGDRTEAISHSILYEEPEPLTAVRTGVPIELDRIVGKTLNKNPDQRYQHLDELSVDLRSLKGQLDAAGLRARTRLMGSRLGWYVAGAVLAVGLLVLAVRWLGVRVQGPRIAEIPLHAVPLTSHLGIELSPTFSPDGNEVAYCWNGPDESNYDIYRQVIGAGEPLRLTAHPDWDYCPSWSPGGKRIAFLRSVGGGRASVILLPALGGIERKLAEVAAFRGFTDARLRGSPPAWSPDANWLLVPDRPSGEEPYSLFLLSVATGEKRRITFPPGTLELGDHSPRFSPDGRSVLFVRGVGGTVGDLYLLSLSAQLAVKGEPEPLTSENGLLYHPQWLPSGRESIFTFAPNAHALSSTLHRLAVPSANPPTALPYVGPGAKQPSLSRLGDRLAYVRHTADLNIMRVTIPGPRIQLAPPDRFASSSQREASPCYSPDGQRIAFSSGRSGANEIWVCNRDGSNTAQLTSFGGPYAGAPRWSPDGQFIVFDSLAPGQRDIYVVRADGGGPPQRLTTHAANDAGPSWSRDGKWIYFGSMRSGQMQVWRIPTGGGEPMQVTQQGGRFPLAGPDGAYLYFAKAMGTMGIWRLPSDGGEESQVVESAFCSGCFTVRREGVYFIAGDGASISLVDSRTRETKKLVDLAEPSPEGFDVSPDGRWALYIQSRQTADLMLVENFR